MKNKQKIKYRRNLSINKILFTVETIQYDIKEYN